MITLDTSGVQPDPNPEPRCLLNIQVKTCNLGSVRYVCYTQCQPETEAQKCMLTHSSLLNLKQKKILRFL